MRRQSKSGFTLVEVLVVIAIIGVLISLLLPAVQRARESGRQVTCLNNLKNLALAMVQYEGSHGQLPPGARLWAGDTGAGFPPAPLRCANFQDDMSWYGMMGPYYEATIFDEKINFKLCWLGVENATVRRYRNPVFQCPSETRQAYVNEGDDARVRTTGSYAVNWGETDYGQRDLGASRFGGRPPAVGGLTLPADYAIPVKYYRATHTKWRAPFSFRESSDLQFSDAKHNTLMLSEIVASKQAGTYDGPYGDITTAGGGGVFMTFLPPLAIESDRSVQCPGDVDPLRYPCTAVANVLDQTFAARSNHSQVVNVAMCDGSGRAVSSTIEPTIWKALGTATGNEPIGDY